MIYYTVRQLPRYKQLSFEDFLYGNAEDFKIEKEYYGTWTPNTKTYCIESVPDKIKNGFHVREVGEKLVRFNEKYKHLIDADKGTLYSSFHIPKKTGGLRKIDAPNQELKKALTELKGILENDFKALYHTSAFAYIKGRSTVDAVKKHQKNSSKWFGKFDLSNFFGSTTMEFVLSMLENIFPFSDFLKTEGGRRELTKALSLGFLDGVLPQGTPLSPILTNIMMIPIDYNISKKLKNREDSTFVYTRYADDFIISSRYDFKFKEIEEIINETLKEFDAPFRINGKKTRYGSSSGRNWNLGVMLNKDNEITVGHQKKKKFKAMLTSYILDRKNGKAWDHNDIQVLDGYRSYYSMIEGKEKIDEILNHIGEKFGANIQQALKEDLSL